MESTAKRVGDLMKAAEVTPAEAFAFMGEALCRQDRDRPGVAYDFLMELVERRGKR